MITKKQTFPHAGLSALTAFLGLFFYSCNNQTDISGYKLLDKQFINEINANVYFFEHIKSGAHVVKFDVKDANKTFGVGFITEPNSDCGTSHIIEHAVLNGSKNFPVKSPFDEMGKTSLNTFLNAFTSPDWTFYPVASMNEKDYFNLMTVYLDAVFFPLIKSDPRIFMQEGWHYELADKDSSISIKGVVYNEMKGAFSNPETEMYYQINKHLFPDNGYGKSSGGHPLAIPSLSYEAFIEYYEQHYHPANCCIFTYGDADMRKELELIDKQYLSTFDRHEVQKKIEFQKPLTEFKKVVAPYASLEGVPTDNQTFISLNWVYGDNRDKTLTWVLKLLSDVLVNQQSAPVRLAIEEAGIGQDIYAYSHSRQQNVFNITIQNANPDEADKAKEIIINTFKEQVAKGIDRSAVEACLNNMEFSLREGDDAQKGLETMLKSFSDWMFTDNPFIGLQWEQQIAETRKTVASQYLEDIVKSALIDNNFGIMLVMEPKAGLEKDIAKETAKKLAEYKASLSPEQLEKLISDTKELIEYQQRENTAEELAVIPKLGRDDLTAKADWYIAEEREVANTKVVHFDNFTNGIIYLNLMFDLRVLPTELIPYAQLLTDILGKMDTEQYSYGELEKEIDKNTGSSGSRIQTYKQKGDDNRLLPKFVYESKAIAEKTDQMFELAAETLYKTNLTDKKRLKTILIRNLAQTESNIKSDGMDYAMTRVSSYYSNHGILNETIRGLDYYRFIANLVSEFDQNADNIIAKLKQTSELLFTRENIIFATSCDQNDYTNLEKAITNFVSNTPSKKQEIVEWKLAPTKKNEALMSSSKVQYVVESYNFKKLGYEWNGKMAVLSSILSDEYLQTTIRVVGGAYGGYAAITNDGTIFFASYRDPNLKETLVNFDGATKFLDTFEADETKMLGYIIGTIANYDRPQTASSKARTAFNRYFSETTESEFQDDRNNILSTSTDDIRSYKKMIEDFLKQDNICVYGGQEKIEANKNLFDNLINIEKR